MATSLTHGETGKKYVGVLEIYKSSIRFRRIELKTVRQFFMKDVVLCDAAGVDPHRAETVEAYLGKQIEELIAHAAANYVEVRGQSLCLRIAVDPTLPSPLP